MKAEKIKIYFQRPWKSDSSYYLYLRQNPPDNVKFLNSEIFDLVSGKNSLKFLNRLKKSVKLGLKLIPNLPNAHFTKNTECDLIHCTHCLSLNKKPWVADMEFLGQFWASGQIADRKSILKLLNKEYCKKIIAWTDWCKKDIVKIFPEIDSITEVVYPAIPEQNSQSKKEKDKINLLFSSRRFYFKGGLHATEIIDRLTKKHTEVYGHIISDVPQEVLSKYSKNKKIKFYGLMNQQKIFQDIYPKSDIFVYPSYTDTFGFGLIEALSFGMPIVTDDSHSRKELVTNGVTGFNIHRPDDWKDEQLKKLEITDLLDEFEKKTEELIKNKKLRNRMSKNALKEIKDGKFSIKQRNEKLSRIYADAVK